MEENKEELELVEQEDIRRVSGMFPDVFNEFVLESRIDSVYQRILLVNDQI